MLGHTHEAKNQQSDGHKRKPDGHIVMPLLLVEGTHGSTEKDQKTRGNLRFSFDET